MSTESKVPCLGHQTEPAQSDFNKRADSVRVSPVEGVDTIEFWRDAYSNPESGEHFLGHGMVVVLLTEYLELRRELNRSASLSADKGILGAMELALAALKKVRHVDMQHAQAEKALEVQIERIKGSAKEGL